MRTALVFVFLTLSVIVTAQNWAPYSGDTLHFSSEGQYYPDISIYQDSFNGDTTYFNTIIDSCFDCGNQGLFLKNQPIFLGYEMVNSDDSLFEFFGADTFNILPHQAIDSTWDYGGGRTAQFIEIKLDSVLEIQDSVKVGVINGIDTFLLSKNHGLLKQPDLVRNKIYELVGVESGIGFQDMKFKDAWNYKVGDVLQYKRFILESDITNLQYSWHNEIMGFVAENESQLIYSIRTGANPNNYMDTINRSEFSNALSGSYVLMENSWLLSDDSYGKVVYKESSDWGLTKIIGYKINDGIVQTSPIIVDLGNETLIETQEFFGLYYRYAYGPGLIATVESHFETYYSTKVTYYSTTTGTYGTYRNIIGIRDTDFSQIQLYPNPTQNKIFISNLAELSKQDESTLEVYNVLGELVISKEIEEPSSFNGLDVSQLRSGVFTVILRSQDIVIGRSKMVVE